MELLDCNDVSVYIGVILNDDRTERDKLGSDDIDAEGKGDRELAGERVEETEEATVRDADTDFEENFVADGERENATVIELNAEKESTILPRVDTDALPERRLLGEENADCVPSTLPDGEKDVRWRAETSVVTVDSKLLTDDVEANSVLIAELLEEEEAKIEGDGIPVAVPTRFDADKDTVDDGDVRDVKVTVDCAVVAADIDATVVMSAVFDDAGDIETVCKEDDEIKADEEAITVFVAPVTVAKTDPDADIEGFDAVAILDTADEAEGDEVPDRVGFEVVEPDWTMDFEESSVITGDCVDNIVVETLKVIPIETVGSAVKESEATFDHDEWPEVEGSTVTDDTTVPLTDALEKGDREFAGDAELSTVNVLTIVTVRVDKLETLTAEEIVNAFVGFALDVDAADSLLVRLDLAERVSNIDVVSTGDIVNKLEILLLETADDDTIDVWLDSEDLTALTLVEIVWRGVIDGFPEDEASLVVVDNGVSNAVNEAWAVDDCEAVVDRDW